MGEGKGEELSNLEGLGASQEIFEVDNVHCRFRMKLGKQKGLIYNGSSNKSAYTVNLMLLSTLR